MAGVDAGDDRLRRGPRHRHAARRSHRGRGADPGVPRRGTERSGLLRHRLGQDQHRPPGRGRGRGRADQDRAGAASTGDPAAASTSSGPTRRSTSREPVLRQHRAAPWTDERRARGAPASAPSASAAPTPTWCSRRRRRASPPAPSRPWQLLRALGPHPVSARARRRGALARLPGAQPSCRWPTSPSRSRPAARPSSTGGSRSRHAGGGRRGAADAARGAGGVSREAASAPWSSCSPAWATSTRTWARAVRDRAGLPRRRWTAAPSTLRARPALVLVAERDPAMSGGLAPAPAQGEALRATALRRRRGPRRRPTTDARSPSRPLRRRVRPGPAVDVAGASGPRP